SGLNFCKWSSMDTVLMDNLFLYPGGPPGDYYAISFYDYPISITNSALLQAAATGTTTGKCEYHLLQLKFADSFSNNAILNHLWSSDISKWIDVVTEQNRGFDFNIANNYWGTTSTALIDKMVVDFFDDFSKGRLNYEPILTTPTTTIYPFVVSANLS